MGGAERGRDEGGLDTGGADKSRRTGREAELMGRERKRTEFRQREIHVCFPSRFIFTVFTLQFSFHIFAFKLFVQQTEFPSSEHVTILR